jgi:hypothetical protein
MKKLNIYNTTENIQNNQEIYDGFNKFIISKDNNVFNKLYTRIQFYEKTKNLCGDIVECGVFKGSGIFTWLKILQLNEPNTIKKVVGFDFFDSSFTDKLNDSIDKDSMKQVFSRCKNLNKTDISKEHIEEQLKNSGFNQDKFDLVKGDIIETSKNYLIDKPGFRISILYLDLDLDQPTYHTLSNFWNNIVTGGIIVFDEYAYHSWSESNGVDKFLKDKNIILNRTNVKAPSAFIVKN